MVQRPWVPSWIELYGRRDQYCNEIAIITEESEDPESDFWLNLYGKWSWGWPSGRKLPSWMAGYRSRALEATKLTDPTLLDFPQNSFGRNHVSIQLKPSISMPKMTAVTRRSFYVTIRKHDLWWCLPIKLMFLRKPTSSVCCIDVCFLHALMVWHEPWSS